MNTKFTYLIGAGASANALPIVNKFEERIKQFSKEFLNDLNAELHEGEVFWTSYCNELKRLAKASSEFGTIDTLAKHYYLTDTAKFEKLKRYISVYFVLEQIYFKKSDKRYLIFLTTIMDSISFPRNLKILNWNYDFQFELAASSFIKDNGATFNKTGIVREGTLINYVPDSGIFNRLEDNDNIDLLHLNGTAGFFKDLEQDYVFSSFHHMEKDIKSNGKLLLNLRSFIEEGKYPTLFTFAWEGRTDDYDNLDYARIMAENTNYLVIIGYSFPFFNRIIDKIVFDSIISSGTLSKIYFQSPNLDGEFLRSQFNIPREILIKHIPDTNNFFIPTEF